VIPVGCIGTEKVQPIGSHVPKLGQNPEIHFGKPMDFSDRTMDSSNLRAMTDEIVSAIQVMTGQEYVPRYTPKRGEPAKADDEPGRPEGEE
jgi:1-acyl-sn-glycerol-3-phosphate acyltransferase